LIELTDAPTEYEILFHEKFNNHRHINLTFGFVDNNFGTIMLLQERAPHGHLQELLKNNHFEPSTMVLIAIFVQIIDAMNYIISQGMIHGDLRCSNVLVFQMDSSKPKENFVKLTNFALAHRDNPLLLNDRRLTIPVQYCAPEILRSAGRLNYSELSDVYSMGVLMWEACSQGKLPYDFSISNREVRQRKLNGEILPRPWTCDRRIWPIIKDCWYNEPQLRSDFKDMKRRLSIINLE
jgi:serine/threonine protein kinase